MAIKFIRIGSSVNVVGYDDTDFDSAIETTEPIKSGSPIDPNDVVILGDVLESVDLFANITGTANQITISDDGDNSITISIPNTAIITFQNTGLHLLDTNASHDLIIKPGSDLTADRTLTLTTGDGDRTFTLSGNLTVESTSLIDQDLTADASVTFAGQQLNGTLTVGADTVGYDTTFWADATNEWVTWDASASQLFIRGKQGPQFQIGRGALGAGKRITFERGLGAEEEFIMNWDNHVNFGVTFHHVALGGFSFMEMILRSDNSGAPLNQGLIREGLFLRGVDMDPVLFFTDFDFTNQSKIEQVGNDLEFTPGLTGGVGNCSIPADNVKWLLGIDGDAGFDYDGDDLVAYPAIVGSGGFIIAPKIKLTTIGGFAIKLVNKTGVNTIAGQLVKSDTATDDGVILTGIGDTECFGVFLDGGIANNAEAWVVIAGIADVAFDDNVAAVHGNWVACGVAAGYAKTQASPAAAPTHFQEAGHCIESVTADGPGTHILARCVLHQN